LWLNFNDTSHHWYFLIYLEIVINFNFSAQKDKLQTRYVSVRSLSSRQWSSTRLLGNAHRHRLFTSRKNPVLGISQWCSLKISFKVLWVSTFMGPMWQHSLNFIATDSVLGFFCNSNFPRESAYQKFTCPQTKFTFPD